MFLRSRDYSYMHWVKLKASTRVEASLLLLLSSTYGGDLLILYCKWILETVALGSSLIGT